MANFKKGAAAIAAATERRSGGAAYTNVLKWAPDQKRYIQFVTGLDDMITALTHEMIIVGTWDKSGKDRLASFISRKDPQIDGPDGYDPLMDVSEMNPVTRTYAVVAELEPTESTVNGRKRITGVKLATRTWEGKDGKVEEPAFYIVSQSPGNFFGYFVTFESEGGEDIRDKVWSVTRRGSQKDTTYDAIAVGGAAPVDLSQFSDALPNLDEYVDELSDLDRAKRLLGNITPETKVNKYHTPPGVAQTSEDKVSPPWNESEDDSADVEEEAPAEKPKRRGSKLASLRNELEAK